MSAIGLTTSVVAGILPSVDEPRDRLISGLPERIQEAAALAKKSENQLSEEIGYARTQLNMTRRRLAENPSVGVDLRIIAGLAKLTGVSLDWLAMGRGPMSVAVGTPEDKARHAAKALGYAAEVIEAGIKGSIGGEDARALFWRIQNAEAVRPANKTEASPEPPKVSIVAKDETADEGDNRKPAKRAAAKAKESGAK